MSFEVASSKKNCQNRDITKETCMFSIVFLERGAKGDVIDGI
jgi:hypothetical protein